jgi:hypothetical protein
MNQRCTLALSATPETVLHTAIGGIPPADYEAAYYAQTQPQQVTGANT